MITQRTPLHVAAGKGYKYTTEVIVKAGADINIKDNDGVCTTYITGLFLSCLASLLGTPKSPIIASYSGHSLNVQAACDMWIRRCVITGEL